jgi:MoxR-like ATPase
MSAIAASSLQPFEPPFFARVRLRAQRRVLWLREQWARDGLPAEGLVIGGAEIDRILGGAEREQEQAFHDTDGNAAALGRAIAEADRRFGDDLRWRALGTNLRLNAAEIDLLALAVALDFDPWFRRVCGYLHDDATVSGASPWLSAQLFGHSPSDALASGGLVHWRLAAPAEAQQMWGPANVWVADPAIAAWLCGRTDGMTPLRVPASRLHERELVQALAFVKPLVDAVPRRAIELQLKGAPGSGRRTFAAQLARELGRDAFAADLGDGAGADAAIRAARTARLADAVLCVTGTEALPPPAWQALRERCDFLVVAAEAAPPRIDAARQIITLGPLTRAARETLWRELTGGEAPAAIADWSLTAGEVVAASHAAPAGEEAVAAACPRLSDRELSELLTSMPLPYTWDDIVLPESVSRELTDFEDQIRLRGAVLDDWGFESLVPGVRGTTAMFAGPSGTGKTMAAQVLARSRGLPLYRVDLANVVNKYIGETEKNIARIFNAAQRAEAILFFDEADALFGRRTQVRDAHDRYANIEIDYLLQRMESFDGIAILATNRKSDLDAAFLRRLRLVIDFSLPAPEERRRLWRLALREKSPRGEELLEEIDWNFLTEKLPLTGAEIKSAVLAAAFRARADESRIAMRHLLHAARREMTKRGAVLRAPEWEK